jgi:site-specific DNA-methyltransferase (adenine-specific)
VVRIEPFHYTGKVWCLKVPTGCFVAVRDGMAFPTGNSGFPKSLDVSKAIDRAAGAEREVVSKELHRNRSSVGGIMNTVEVPRYNTITAPATPEAQQWAGWGTALKPALEPITMARKPLTGTVAANVIQHGTGALNVDGCRVEAVEGRPLIISHGDGFGSGEHITAYGNGLSGSRHGGTTTTGRWPANLIHDGSDEPYGLLQDAARFFYTAKASKAERQGVTHPTVKPIELMAYLCRLVTPAGGTVLDPFMGSGTTIKAALSEGFNAIGIERDPAYFEMAQHRMDGAQMGLSL